MMFYQTEAKPQGWRAMALFDDRGDRLVYLGRSSTQVRAGFVEVSEARSDWAPDPANPLPKFTPPRRVPHGITIVGRLFEDGLVGQVGLALEKAFGVAAERPSGF